MNRTIPISEIFPAIQGEGPLLGVPTIFVRTGGCDYRCSWCDSLHAVLPEHKADWRPMTPPDIIQGIMALAGGKPYVVTLSGGNPAIHRNLGELVELLHVNGFQAAIETQGSISQPWYAGLDYLVLSPKPPSSGMVTDWSKLRGCVEAGKGAPTFLKVVVFDEADYLYARQVHRTFPRLPFYLQVGNPSPPQVGEANPLALLERLRWLSERALADHWHDVRVTPQLHALLYGNERGR